MADRFLREVKRMHELRQDINKMTPEEADELIRGLGDDAAEDWVFAARDAQLPPPGLSWCWLFLGGRGAGKSHSMSAAVHTAVRAGIKRIHFIAPTTTDFHDVNVEGKSGIFATCGRDPRPRWVSHRLGGIGDRRFLWRKHNGLPLQFARCILRPWVPLAWLLRRFLRWNHRGRFWQLVGRHAASARELLGLDPSQEGLF